ncbi:uncharacterized protein [Dysidea avara]|uniref:uncharacterized protein n=1 Tax=Dysidea avara TaxID=196820 RepID=UPI0033236C60
MQITDYTHVLLQNVEGAHTSSSRSLTTSLICTTPSVSSITPSLRPLTPSPILLTPSLVSLTPSSVLLIPSSMSLPSSFTSKTTTSVTMAPTSYQRTERSTHTSLARPVSVRVYKPNVVDWQQDPSTSVIASTTISSALTSVSVSSSPTRSSVDASLSMPSTIIMPPPTASIVARSQYLASAVAGATLQSADATHVNATLVPTTVENAVSLLPSTAGDDYVEKHTLTSKLSRQPTDYALRLPAAWRDHMNVGDQQWIGRTVFSAQNTISDTVAAKLWWYPPIADLKTTQPKPESYVLRRICVWMPRRAWSIDLKCPNCHLRSLQ